MAELDRCVVGGRDCLTASAVFMDESGDASVFWHEADPSSANPGWYGALNQPRSRAVGAHALVSPHLNVAFKPQALGDNRFAAIEWNWDTSRWTSALVDLSVPSTPTVSSRVDTPVTNSDAQWISGMDGVFALGATVPVQEFSIGGAAKARGVRPQVPAGYVGSGGWPVFAPAVGVAPAAWWALDATEPSASDSALYLARIALPSGDIVRNNAVSRRPQINTGPASCFPMERAPLLMREWSVGNASIAWVEGNAGNNGCDIYVDGVNLTTPNQSANAVYGLAGGSAGPMAIWSERTIAGDGAKVVWRRRDGGVWSAAAPISDDTVSGLIADVRSAGDAVAIAWKGCTSSLVNTCASYVSKYVNGQWQTKQFGEVGEEVWSVQLAVNQSGQAIVVWQNLYTARCSGDSGKHCPRVLAYRF